MIRVSNEDILATMAACGGNQSETARRLGMQRRQVQRRLMEIRGEKEKGLWRSVTMTKDRYWWLRKTMARLDMPTIQATLEKIFTEWEART
jgi:hypothetical protein